MKNLIFFSKSFAFVLCSSILLLLFGCPKDPCADVPCVNGSCFEGICDCDLGFYGSSCQNYDPCHNVPCYNGVCENGNCKCDVGYIGENCDIEMTPLGFLISKIEITKFPVYKNGIDCWDNEPTCFADVYLRFNKGTTYYGETTHISNCNQNTSMIYTGGNLPIYLETGYTYDFKMYDNDGTGIAIDDLMMDSQIEIGKFSDGFKPILSLNAGSDFSFKFTGEWVF